MNKNLGMFLVFIALILLSVLVVNGLYFNTPTVESTEVEEKTEKFITTSLSISREQKYDPDIVDVIIGFKNENINRSQAVKENNETVNKIMEILKEEELLNIETQDFRVYPYARYEENEVNKEKKTTYYRVNNQIKFTSKNLAELPVLLGKLLDAGANKVLNIDYRLENNKKALNDQTAKALNSLKEKASFLVENLNKENYRIKKVNFDHQNIYSSDMQNSLVKSSESTNRSEVPLAEQKVNIRVSLSAEVELY